jgi:hypothetical protein
VALEVEQVGARLHLAADLRALQRRQRGVAVEEPFDIVVVGVGVVSRRVLPVAAVLLDVAAVPVVLVHTRAFVTAGKCLREP